MSFLLGQQAVQAKTKSPPVTSNQRWIALAPHVKRHFDTGNKSLKDIAFDLAWADYLQQKKKDDQWKKFEKVI